MSEFRRVRAGATPQSGPEYLLTAASGGGGDDPAADADLASERKITEWVRTSRRCVRCGMTRERAVVGCLLQCACGGHWLAGFMWGTGFGFHRP